METCQHSPAWANHVQQAPITILSPSSLSLRRPQAAWPPDWLLRRQLRGCEPRHWGLMDCVAPLREALKHVRAWQSVVTAAGNGRSMAAGALTKLIIWTNDGRQAGSAHFDTNARGSGQSKQRVDMTRVCVSVCVCVDGASCRYDESAHVAQSRGGFVSAVGLVWNNKPPAFWLDSGEGGGKAGQTADASQAATHLSSSNNRKKKHVELLCAHFHTKREGWFAWPRRRQLFNFLLFHVDATQTIVFRWAASLPRG